MVKFNHTKHKELWQWLADNPTKCKADWPQRYDVKHFTVCYACETAEDLLHEDNMHAQSPDEESSNRCYFCPFNPFGDWDCSNARGEDTACLAGLYDAWVRAWDEYDQVKSYEDGLLMDHVQEYRRKVVRAAEAIRDVSLPEFPEGYKLLIKVI